MGGTLVALFYPWIAQFGPQRDAITLAILSAWLFIVSMALPLLFLLWRLRIDQDGIYRRRFFYWDDWSWADFASGRIEKHYQYKLYDPSRSMFRRRLELGFMDSDDIQSAFAAINQHYRLPPPPEIRLLVTIKYGFRRSLTLKQQGLRIRHGKHTRDYVWSDVQHVHITRPEPVRRDFDSLRIVLPDQEIELGMVPHQGGTSPTWTGATADEINEILHHKIPSDRIDVSIQGEPLKSREELEKRLRKREKAHTVLVFASVVFTSLYCSLLVWTALTEGIPKVLFMGAMATIFLGSVVLFVCRASKAEINKLKNELESLPANEQ